MGQVTIIGIDLAKRDIEVFSYSIADTNGQNSDVFDNGENHRF